MALFSSLFIFIFPAMETQILTIDFRGWFTGLIISSELLSSKSEIIYEFPTFGMVLGIITALSFMYFIEFKKLPENKLNSKFLIIFSFSYILTGYFWFLQNNLNAAWTIFNTNFGYVFIYITATFHFLTALVEIAQQNSIYTNERVEKKISDLTGKLKVCLECQEIQPVESFPCRKCKNNVFKQI